MRLTNGRGLDFSIGPRYSNGARDDGLGIEVGYLALSGADPLSDPRFRSVPGSNLVATGTRASGSLAFSGLVLHSGERVDGVDIAGTVTWSCPATP
jgi:hypothetical protein